MAAWTPEKSLAFKSAFYDFLRSCVIMSKEKGPICLGDHLYLGQHMLFDKIFAGLGRDIHDYKALKSRQLGFSTSARALGLFWLGVHDGLQGAMVFDTDQNKENARNEIETMVRNLPKRLKFPRIKSYNRYGLTLENDSKLSFMSAGIKKGKGSGQLGRSLGLNFAILSEICSYQNEEGLISFKQALSESFENRLYLAESTARGYNIWHKMWKEAKGDPLNQETIFVGFWAKETQRLERDSEAFRHYMLIAPTPEELAKIREVKDRYGVDVPMEALAWYRRKVDPSRDRDPSENADAFTMGEQPWVEEDSFQTTGSTFFRADKLNDSMRLASEQRFSGFKYFPGMDFPHTDFVPARYGRDVHLRVWEEPDPFGVYTISADPAFGHSEDNDRSACQVMRCYADKLVQVAEFASASTTTQQFAWLIAALCGWYNSVTFILEINGPGEAVWNEFRNLPKLLQGYLKSAATERGIRDVLTNVRNYVYQKADSWSSGHSVHFRTTTQTKIAIMERLRDFQTDGTLILNSVEAIEEMRTVVRDGDSIKADGGRGSHDDRVFALALAIRSWEDRLRPSLIAQGRTMAVEVSRKQLTPRGRYEIFTKNQLDNFLKRKTDQRLAQQAQQSYKSWRYK